MRRFKCTEKIPNFRQKPEVRDSFLFGHHSNQNDLTGGRIYLRILPSVCISFKVTVHDFIFLKIAHMIV